MGSPTALNEQFLVGNTCFGCGPANPEGLQIRIYRDGERTDRLVGTYRPRESHGGFPAIVHGGLQFTVLDCMAGWVMFILRAPARATMPLTKSAVMRFSRPALVTDVLSLAAQVTREAASPREPISIHTEIRNVRDELLSDADFEYVMLPADKFQKIAGLKEFPDSYRRHFGEP